MSTAETIIPEDVLADLEAAADALDSGKPLDGETERRIRERAERIREAVYGRQGMLDVAVDLIREIRESR
jgi:hypothetical protein